MLCMVDVNQFPKFYDVDDVLVKVDYDPDTNEMFAVTAGGKDYPPVKASFEGEEVDEKAFNERVEKVAQSNNASESASAASL